MGSKIAIVTGANSGLGFATTEALAAIGTEVIMVCRSEKKGKIAQQQIIESTKNPNIHLILIDLSKQSDIWQGALQIKQRWSKVDVLINNAAAVISEHTLSEDGIEMQFAINHLAYVLLTHALMPLLQSSKQSRIINISSGNHRKGKIHFEDLNLTENYQVLTAYNQSKLANVYFTYELHRQLQKAGLDHVTVNAVDPGTNFTDIGVKATNFFHSLAWKLRRLVSLQPSEGAKTQIHVAVAPDLAKISGKFWYLSKPIRSAKATYEEAIAERLWKESLQLCQIEDYFIPDFPKL